MSTYKTQAFHPETGILEEATFIDDFYGKHRYGVKFAGDRVYRAEQVRVPQTVVQDRTEDHDFGPNRPRPIVQTAEGFKVDTHDPAIIEAAVQALLFDDFQEITNPSEELHRVAHRVLAAVVPLIRAATLEEAAKVLDDDDGYHPWAASEWDVDLLKRNSRELAAALRALKEQP